MAEIRAPFIVCRSGEWLEDFKPPSVSVLNFSGGKQSSALLWMVLRGDIKPLGKLLVLNADPGMENTFTYEYVRMMRQECESAGIQFITAPGPNLYQDLIGLKGSGKTRLDLPAYYTKSADGKKGKLLQRCTAYYKIAPMDRELRSFMRRNKLRLIANSVHKWIGFSANEVHRIKPPNAAYTAFRYPLVELGLSNKDVEEYLRDNKLPVPPRSVCNACFANSPAFMADMRLKRPSDYAQALAVDSAIRDLSQIGVRDEVYILSNLMPVKDAVDSVNPSDYLDYSDVCESGYCFV